MMNKQPLIGLLASTAVAVATLVATPGDAVACTGQPLTVGWMADHSAAVVTARVVSIRSYWTPGRASIESELTLADVVYLNGAAPGTSDTLTVVFPGGTVGETTMRLCCAPIVEPGERWLMFLQPTYRTHPAVGMGQGMFRVESDELGVDRLFTASGRPLVGLSELGVPRAEPVRAAPKAISDRVLATHGSIRAVRTASVQPIAQPAQPMALELFVQTIAADLRGVAPTANSTQIASPVREALIPSTLVEAPSRNASASEKAQPTRALRRPQAAPSPTGADAEAIR